MQLSNEGPEAKSQEMTMSRRDHRRALPAIVLSIVTLVISCKSPHHPQAPPRGPSNLLHVAHPIPNQYIVILKRDAGQSSFAAISEAADQLLSKNGGTKGHVYQFGVQGFSVKMTEAQAQGVAADPRVKYVEEDGVMTVQTTRATQLWNLDRIDQRDPKGDKTYSYDATGKGVHAYVIDTGVRASHHEFGGRASSSYSAMDDGPDGTPDADDGAGHGTHVAGIIGASDYGVAPDVQIHAVRVFPWGEEETATSNIIAGVDWVTGHHEKPAVSNMSVGGAASQALDDKVRASIFSGVTYVVAAGRPNADACGVSPARVKEAITVGDTDKLDYRDSSSNWGACVQLFAPGVGVLSTFNRGDDDVERLDGTSMAAALVAGVVARYLEKNPGAVPGEVTWRIVQLGTRDVIQDPGPGSPNVLLFVPPTI
jgi:subtilisin family serine protease